MPYQPPSTPLTHPTLTIRPAVPSDLLPAAHLAAKAFFDTELFGEIIHPFRHEFPEDMHLYWLRGFRGALKAMERRKRRVMEGEEGEVEVMVDSDTQILVAVSSEEEEEVGGRVVGVAVWVRKRGEEEKKEGGGKKEREEEEEEGEEEGEEEEEEEGDEEEEEAELPINRAADPAKLDILSRSQPFTAHKWSGHRASTWYLANLAISPSHQGQGIGKRLVRWGFVQAEKEGVCVSVISALGKDGFYRRCGFDVEDGHATEGEGNPLSGVPGGLVMFRDRV